MLSDDILDYIENNLKRDLTLVELSRKYHYSPRQLYYRLHAMTGMPIMTYIRKRKLVNAAREIALGRKIYDVAADYGFDTQAGFYKAFLQCIGCTPSEFQNHQRLHSQKKISRKLQLIQEELQEMAKDNTKISEMSEIIIRKVRQTDAKSLWENIFSGNTLEETEERVRKNIAQMDCGSCIALVAAVGENIIAAALAARSQHILSSNRWELADVVVNPAFQRQGLGKKICLECFRHAKDMGCDYVITSCRSNGTEAFDKALGMELCGRIPNGILEPWGSRNTYDELIFYKRL